jgi:hypothetical protein
MSTGDDVLCIAAVHHFGALPASDWPKVAAHLVAAGYNGDDLFGLASHSAKESKWVIDELVPGVLADIGAPALTDDGAAEVIARLVSQVTPAGGHPITGSLGKIAREREGPSSGLVDQARLMCENLSTGGEVVPAERLEADRFEARLRSLPPTNVPPALAEILARSL